MFLFVVWLIGAIVTAASIAYILSRSNADLEGGESFALFAGAFAVVFWPVTAVLGLPIGAALWMWNLGARHRKK
jgi:hypothetical protein